MANKRQRRTRRMRAEGIPKDDIKLINHLHKRGFGSMTEEERKRIAALGGAASKPPTKDPLQGV